MTALALHNHAPMLASGTHNQYIKIFDLKGEPKGMIRYHEGFIGQRIGPVSCLTFHPNRLALAAGFTDSGMVCVYT